MAYLLNLAGERVVFHSETMWAVLRTSGRKSECRKSEVELCVDYFVACLDGYLPQRGTTGEVEEGKCKVEAWDFGIDVNC